MVRENGDSFCDEIMKEGLANTEKQATATTTRATRDDEYERMNTGRIEEKNSWLHNVFFVASV